MGDISINLIIAALLIALLLFFWWSIRKCERACEVDWGRPWLNRLDGLNRIFCRRFHGLRHDPITLPDNKGVLIASNHISGLDPLLLTAACKRPLRFIIAREQYERWWLRWLFKGMGCIPVDRINNPRQAFRVALEALNQGEAVAIFPHGGIHLPHEPQIRLKRGVALLAQMASVPVQPLRINGVRGQGTGVIAVLIPSKARVTSFELIHFHKDMISGLNSLASYIGGLGPEKP